MTSKDQVAQLIVGEAKARGHSRGECLAEMSALYQESQWDETIWDGTHVTYGVAQQDGSYAHRFEGAAAQVKAFFDKLDVKRASPGHGDIWLNICWLQQAPNWSSASYWWDHGRRAYLTEIKSRIATVTPYLDKYWPTTTGETPMTWTGDPVWLEDVLRPVLGDRLKTLAGWKGAGHGDFKDIRGVMVHHTGNSAESAQSIRNGRPDLEGPLANLHIAPDGTVTIVAVGVCWHAGVGSYPWLPTNNANWHMIGIECAWPTIGAGGSYNPQERWPDKQFESMLDTCAALSRKLGTPADHVIGHKDYAGAAQGKWDPGNVDMNLFRRWVGERMAIQEGQPAPGPTPQPQPQPGPAQPPILPQPLDGWTDRALLEEVLKQLRGSELRGWPQLAGKTVVDSLADAHRKLDELLKREDA